MRFPSQCSTRKRKNSITAPPKNKTSVSLTQFCVSPSTTSRLSLFPPLFSIFLLNLRVFQLWNFPSPWAIASFLSLPTPFLLRDYITVYCSHRVQICNLSPSFCLPLSVFSPLPCMTLSLSASHTHKHTRAQEHTQLSDVIHCGL